MLKKYFYNLLFKYLSFYIRQTDKVVIMEPLNYSLVQQFSNVRVARRDGKEPSASVKSIGFDELKDDDPDFILLNGIIHYEKDIYALFQQVHAQCHKHTRLVITYYSAFWRPAIRLGRYFNFFDNLPESNWISPEDIENLLLLGDFEIIRSEPKVLFPFYIPVLSNLINRYIAPLPFFRNFCLINIVVARPLQHPHAAASEKSVSIVVAARNEEGNIENILKRLPKMGPEDELILIEGNSTDHTWEKIQEVYQKNKHLMNMKIAQQDGKGKGDAVRKGFDMATRDILMILDADLTVPPEDLPKFYDALISGKGEFINGSRLVYPMEKQAMRFFNILGNKFFAMAFSFILGQRFKDTLCGTKVISRENYLKLAEHRSYFGEFDPFGDFDLIFGSARMGLKIVEVPIRYKERIYGDTNISRWRHGLILLKMVIFAGRKIKFI